MRTVPAALQAHLDQVDTTTTRLLKVTLKSGQVYGLAMLDRNVPYDDGEYEGEIDYIATNGFDASTISADIGYSVDNAEGYALVSDLVPGITTAMAEAGELDDATWVCYLVNYEDLSQGHVILDAGDLGEVRTKHGMIWIPELLSYVMRLRQPIGGVWSRQCRAIFGSPADSQTGCGVDLEPLWVNGEVVAVGAETDRVFQGDAILDSSSGVIPSPGRVQWLTGVNAGREYAVEEIGGDEVTLSEPTLYAIEVGDTYRIRPDCKKHYIRDCIGVWDNGLNFKGEPYIPVGDAASIQAPGAQQPVGGGYVAPPESPVEEPEEPPVEPPEPPPGDDAEYWPNWPMMNAICLQGSISATLLDSSTHSMLADKDVVIIQSHYETTARHTLRDAAIDDVHALQVAPMNTKFFLYVYPSTSVKNFPAIPGQNEKEMTKELIEDPVKGNLRWYVHRVGGALTTANRVEEYYRPAETWQNNVGARTTDVNSIGETFHYAYWKEKNIRLAIAPDLRPNLAGFFMDVAVARPTRWSRANGTITVNDADLDYDGVPDSPTDWSSGPGAGARMWCEGQLRFKAEMEARFPGKHMIPNSPWDANYFDGQGTPPLPLSDHPFYRQWELPMDEVSNYSLGLRPSGTSYVYNGGGSAFSFFRSYSIQERMVKLDADIPAVIGKGAVLCHAHAVNRTPTSTDLQFMRTCTLICMLVERAAPCVQPGASRVFSLDEQLLEYGNPLATRTMGTFNESTIDFDLRAPNQIVGSERFYWAEYEQCIVVGNLTNPAVGTWPSGSAGTCTLPDPGPGKKWQMPDFDGYENPVTGRETRNQSPSLYNGTDVTTVSLQRFCFVVVLRVDE
jgi:uncharacterized phage protein (TIGR02218 family)